MPNSTPETRPLAETYATRFASWMCLFITCLCSAALFLASTRSQGYFLDLFSHVGSIDRFSATTKLALQPAFPWTVLLLAVAGLTKEMLIRNRKVTLLINAGHVLLVFFFAGICCMAFSVPLVRLQLQNIMDK